MRRDAAGHSLHLELTAGQAHDASAFDTVMGGADAVLVDEDHQPIAWRVAWAGDQGYRAAWNDDYLLALNITPVIPSKVNEDRDARPAPFDKSMYRHRNIVERLIG